VYLTHGTNDVLYNDDDDDDDDDDELVWPPRVVGALFRGAGCVDINHV
jgi:hypothetical protein